MVNIAFLLLFFRLALIATNLIDEIVMNLINEDYFRFRLYCMKNHWYEYPLLVRLLISVPIFLILSKNKKQKRFINMTVF